jgi:hypothetical protein
MMYVPTVRRLFIHTFSSLPRNGACMRGHGAHCAAVEHSHAPCARRITMRAGEFVDAPVRRHQHLRMEPFDRIRDVR